PAVRVLRAEQVCLILDYATLTTRQPGKVKPYRVSERWDDDTPLCRQHLHTAAKEVPQCQRLRLQL
ncbi:hypothetical protein NQZ68_001945, partial [Dissostichus eleginoides]